MNNYESIQGETPQYVQSAIQKYLTGPNLFVDGVRNAFIRRLCGNLGAFHHNMGTMNAVVFQMCRILIRCRADFIQKSFVTIPHIQHQRVLCLTPNNIRVLQNMISPEMMERLHAGDAGGALEMLGMTARSADQVVAAVTENLEKELTGIKRLYDFKATIEYSSEAAKAKALEALEEKMARLQSRIEAIQVRLRAPTEQTCPICFGEVQVPAMTPCCRNLFCFACACEAFRRSNACAMCREPLASIQDLQVMTETTPVAAEREPTATLLTKDAEFRRFVLENPAARILVFSSYDATFGTLSGILGDEGVSHAILQGSNNHITRLIRDFTAGKYRVLFLNSRNMGAGLNIPSTTHILLYHHMAVEMQNQIIGRAMRLGRTADLQVVHLLHGNEMVHYDDDDDDADRNSDV
jgi:Helicase conserved C-terminal domain